MGDDFFDKLDGKLASLESGQAAKAAQKDADMAFSQAAMAKARPVAESYAAKLQDRGITAKVSGGDYGLSVEMRWKDGAEHGLSLRPDLETGRLDVVRKSTDHTTGKRFSSSNGIPYNESNWTDSTFESALKSVIDDYVFYADKHGGVA